MASPEIYLIRQQLTEVLSYTFDYTNFMVSGVTVSGVDSSVTPATGAPTVADASTASTVVITIGPTTTAGSYVITVTTTFSNSNVEIFKINFTAVADSA